MSALLMFLYGVASYAFFFGTFTYTIAFIGNLPPAPRTIDLGPPTPAGIAVLVNLALLAVFAVQHSVMARRGFKRWWTRIVPETIERSTYVLAATLALALLLWQWRPMPALVWSIEQPAAVVAVDIVFWLGWVVLFTSTFLINHFELFGLRQVFARLAGLESRPAEFRTPFLYRHVRHPLYLGFTLAFWATPRMTAGHLLFAAGCTAYILVGIWFEERDLVAQFGDRYRAYREQVSMLLPWPGKRAARSPAQR
jgi:protein-S-isoprenylcysteine O-methyltransferase Ste14